MDLLAAILAGVLVCGAVGIVIALAMRVLQAVGLRRARRHKWSKHRMHVLTDTMVHYRANIRTMKNAVKPAG